MKKYSCIIVDDEPQAIDLLQDMITTIYPTSIEIAGCYTRWTNALEALRTNEFDILFLDISMQGQNSINLLKALPQIKSEIIFITAYADYAIDAFKMTAAGYIVKPVDPAALITTVDKVLERVKHKKLAETGRTPLATFSKIGIPNNNAIDYVNISDIIYLEAEGSYTNVVLNDRVICSSYNLQKFKHSLDEHNFFQVHRSYIVNLAHISRYKTSGTVLTSNNKELPVARGIREDFLGLFGRIKNTLED